MRKVIQGNLGEDTKIRMWGAGSSGFSTATAVLGKTNAELAKHYQLDIWHTSYDNPAQRAKEGYQIVNCRDAFLYGNPGRTNRDVPNAEYLFNDWNPTNFGGNNPLLGEPNLMGAKAVIWGDQSQEGMTEKDVHQRVLQAIAIVSEKTWNGTDEEDTFAEWEIRFGHLAEGPGTEIAMTVESKSSLVLSYDFENVSEDGTVVYDASGNGYDAVVTGGEAADGWMKFDGDTLLETPVKTLSYPYTATVRMKLSAEDGAANTKESSLFSGYDGRIQVAGYNGNMSADVNYFTRNFGYKVPTNDTEVEVTVVGTFQGTKLYVDGECVAFLSQKADADGLQGAVTSLYSSVLLPLEKIGQDFNGQMSAIKVYNKAFSAEEIAAAYAGTDDDMVNVAQDTYTGSNSYRSMSMQDNGEQRTRISMKVVDGDAFVVQADKTAQPDTTTSDIYSYWKGNHQDSAITIDLGEARDISKVDIQWRYGGKGKNFNILTSMDGENWNVAKQITNNQDFFQSIVLDTAVTARYVKMQGIASNASVYMIQEMMVYEKVDKEALNTVLAEAEAIVEADDLGFGAEDANEAAFFEAVVLAKAMAENPLATKKESAEATTALEAAMEAYLTAAPEPTPEVTEAPQPTGTPEVKDEVTTVFDDVYTDWYTDYVQYVYDNNLMTGIKGTKHFAPNANITKAQVAQVLYNMEGQPAVEEQKVFTDLKDVYSAEWYANAVAWAYNNQIVTGDLNTKQFNPNADVTREQLALMMFRYAGFKGYDVSASSDLAGLKNAENVNNWAADGVKWAVGAGLISGIEKDGVKDLAPQGNASRAQVAAILQRFCEAYK